MTSFDSRNWKPFGWKCTPCLVLIFQTKLGWSTWGLNGLHTFKILLLSKIWTDEWLNCITDKIAVFWINKISLFLNFFTDVQIVNVVLTLFISGRWHQSGPQSTIRYSKNWRGLVPRKNPSIYIQVMEHGIFKFENKVCLYFFRILWPCIPPIKNTKWLPGVVVWPLLSAVICRHIWHFNEQSACLWQYCPRYLSTLKGQQFIGITEHRQAISLFPKIGQNWSELERYLQQVDWHNKWKWWDLELDNLTQIASYFRQLR